MTRVERVTTDERLEDGFDVRRAVFIEEQGVSESEEMDGRDGEATQFVAYDDDYPVGTARVRTPDDGVGKVERVAVREQYRRRGVGEAIMKRIESWANDRGFDRLKLHAQTRVEGFYADLGYETTSGVFEEAGIDHVAMEKSLQDDDAGPGPDPT
ncbi:MAG: GNAT family N-acetyltransferase [Haloarculaceae archaeon]